MAYPEAVWERAMTVQAVLLKAVSGEIHGFRAADILGWSPRTLRRWRERWLSAPGRRRAPSTNDT
jgi:hypothetical protein